MTICLTIYVYDSCGVSIKRAAVDFEVSSYTIGTLITFRKTNSEYKNVMQVSKTAN